MKTDVKADSIKSIFGQRVRQERINKSLSQSKFALDIGIYRSYMGKIERGEQNLTIEMMNKIAEYFTLSLSDMLDPTKLDTEKEYRLKVGRKKKSSYKQLDHE